jgi:hypothetical protein
LCYRGKMDGLVEMDKKWISGYNLVKAHIFLVKAV